MAKRTRAPGVVGVLGAPAVAHVDYRGELAVDGVTISWLVGAEDRWHDPRDDAAVRQQRVLPAPAYETRLRVPSGDAVLRVYGARGRNGAQALVVEVENASPAPFAVACVLTTDRERTHRITVEDTDVRVDGRTVLVLPRPPMRWSTADAATGTRTAVTNGLARPAPFVAFEAAGAEAALVFPLSHRAVFRVAVPFCSPDGAPVQPDAFPPLELVQHGWSSQLDRGMRVEVPAPLDLRVDGARATALLEAALDAPNAATIANLEDWGFDHETVDAWRRASFRTRRHASRRAPPRRHADLGRLRDEELLRALRDLLISDRKDEVDLLPGFPPEWVGAPLAVHDAPTRAGLVSFAVRWHGERPALLWDAPEGVRLRAPVLDPSWSAGGGRGETLLRAWPASRDAEAGPVAGGAEADGAPPPIAGSGSFR